MQWSSKAAMEESYFSEFGPRENHDDDDDGDDETDDDDGGGGDDDDDDDDDGGGGDDDDDDGDDDGDDHYYYDAVFFCPTYKPNQHRARISSETRLRFLGFAFCDGMHMLNSLRQLV